MGFEASQYHVQSIGQCLEDIDLIALHLLTNPVKPSAQPVPKTIGLQSARMAKDMFTPASDMFHSPYCENVFWTFLFENCLRGRETRKGCFVLTRLMDQLQATDPKIDHNCTRSTQNCHKRDWKEFDKEGKNWGSYNWCASLLFDLKHPYSRRSPYCPWIFWTRTKNAPKLNMKRI